MKSLMEVANKMRDVLDIQRKRRQRLEDMGTTHHNVTTHTQVAHF